MHTKNLEGRGVKLHVEHWEMKFRYSHQVFYTQLNKKIYNELCFKIKQIHICFIPSCTTIICVVAHKSDF